MKKRVGAIVLAIGLLFVLADAAGAGGIWGNGGKPPGRDAAPAGSVWGGNGHGKREAAPAGMIWGGGGKPPAPSSVIWGGGQKPPAPSGNGRAGWGPMLDAWLAGLRGLTY